MCGIAGTVSLNPQQVSYDRLKKMTDSIAHRGPDGEGHWINKTGIAGFGHRRLSIIDLSAAAAQPMHWLNRYTITYNGEIYNYIELKKELAGKGYLFTTQSDTEVIMAAYHYWKEKCLLYFDGMFAFAIWDEEEQTLFAARDRLGEKPFFYCFNDDSLLFASEMKALWATGFDKKVNEKLLYNFITLGYTHNPAVAGETAYQQIYKLPAASFFKYIIGTGNSITPILYWKVNNTVNNTITEASAIEKFSALFKESVNKRLRSDVPVGTSLSGGLDSSSIAIIINLLQQDTRLQTFSAVFPGFKTDETQHIQVLISKTDIDNFTVTPTAEQFAADFEKLCFYQEGFIGSASIYAQYRVFELAKQHHIKVLLDGQGADEIMAGYHKYYHWYWQQLYLSNKNLLTQELTAARQLGVQEAWNWKNKLAARWPQYAGDYLSSTRRKLQLHSGHIDKNFAAAFGTPYYQLPLQDKLDNVLYYNSFQNGLEELLQYADRNSMAHGREVRLPFLQHELVEYLFTVPTHLKINSGRTKWLLRKSMQNLLPPEIVWRKDKVGFEPPQQNWMQDARVQEQIREAKSALVEKGILNKSVIAKKIQPQDGPAADNFDWRYLSVAKLF